MGVRRHFTTAVLMFAACGHGSAQPDRLTPTAEKTSSVPPLPPEALPFLTIDQPLDQWLGAGAPIIGGLVMRGRLGSATDQLSGATGSVSVSCDACVLASHTKPLPLGHVDAIVKFENGHGMVDGHLGSAETFELTATGTIDLADSWDKSDLDVHLAFRVGRALDDNARAIVETTRAYLGNDGWMHIHLVGRVGAPTRLAQI